MFLLIEMRLADAYIDGVTVQDLISFLIDLTANP
jgi:hypothetical protein